MRTEYIWKIEVKNTPTLKRKCNHCSCNKFYCSDKFRVNAQKRNIDVWLIYRCIECDSTYNLTIFSRTKPELMKKELFSKFSENDEVTAHKYAFSAEIGRKNSVEIDWSSVEYEIQHDNISINSLLDADHEIIAFKIQMPYEFGLKLSTVIRSCLGLSANLLEQIISAEAIFTPENYPLKKHKAKNGDIVLINKKKLQHIYNKTV
ncbi:DUF1062 domain-containing protein [Bacteroides sp.]|uniref:DUF1062 domain-containing protein n=1 Tax=Bacteroides sp. TaxID=29523 RepID=UPI002612308C|nr:DUF1062 domain-containing protein [Bacteroides sp.]